MDNSRILSRKKERKKENVSLTEKLLNETLIVEKTDDIRSEKKMANMPGVMFNKHDSVRMTGKKGFDIQSLIIHLSLSAASQPSGPQAQETQLRKIITDTAITIAHCTELQCFPSPPSIISRNFISVRCRFLIPKQASAELRQAGWDVVQQQKPAE